jgi:membrane-bound serine protease (ClpP class)
VQPAASRALPHEGARVRVISRQGLTLTVEPIDGEREAGHS